MMDRAETEVKGNEAILKAMQELGIAKDPGMTLNVLAYTAACVILATEVVNLFDPVNRKAMLTYFADLINQNVEVLRSEVSDSEVN